MACSCFVESTVEYNVLKLILFLLNQMDFIVIFSLFLQLNRERIKKKLDHHIRLTDVDEFLFFSVQIEKKNTRLLSCLTSSLQKKENWNLSIRSSISINKKLNKRTRWFIKQIICKQQSQIFYYHYYHRFMSITSDILYSFDVFFSSIITMQLVRHLHVDNMGRMKCI